MKRRKGQPKRGQCVYCGNITDLTDDHIPPKNLFPKPRPPLITVPSCEKCNQQGSKDDRYFQTMLTVREDTFGHPDAAKVYGQVMRKLKTPESAGFRNSLLKSITWVDVFSPGGVLLGRKRGYAVKTNRLEKILTRITKGLFYHENGVRLPDNYGVSLFFASPSDRFTEEQEEAIKQFLQLFGPRSRVVVGNFVFSYKMIRAQDDSFVSAWLLLFYERVWFLTLTMPHDISSLKDK